MTNNNFDIREWRMQQALKEAEGDEVEAEHIYFDYIRSQFLG